MFLHSRGGGRHGRRSVAAWPDQAVGEPTMIHADLVVVGELSTDGHIEVEGRVEGTINSRTVAVREDGRVEGSILADSIEIWGTVLGPVRANHVMVGKNARVIGNIFHNTLTVEPGAFIDGHRPWRPRIDRKLDSA